MQNIVPRLFMAISLWSGAWPVVAAAAEPTVKRATSGICYEKSQKGYLDVRTYKPFDSLEACVQAGGRLPNLKGIFANAAPAAPAGAVATASSATGSTSGQRASDRKLFDTDEPGIIKKSRNGICHEPSSGSYGDTVHFAAYRTLQDCLQSGGREVAKRAP